MVVTPSGRETRVARIVSYEGDLEQAVAGQSVTLILADELDVTRGDVLAAAAVLTHWLRLYRGAAPVVQQELAPVTVNGMIGIVAAILSLKSKRQGKEVDGRQIDIDGIALQQ